MESPDAHKFWCTPTRPMSRPTPLRPQCRVMLAQGALADRSGTSRGRRVERKAIDAYRFFIDMSSLRGWRLPEHRLRLASIRRRHNRDSWHRGDRLEVRLDACL